MNYSTFQTVIMERLERDIPDPKHISIQQVTKNNGIVLDGLSIMENDCNISPTLYLNYYYDSYITGHPEILIPLFSQTFPTSETKSP